MGFTPNHQNIKIKIKRFQNNHYNFYNLYIYIGNGTNFIPYFYTHFFYLGAQYTLIKLYLLYIKHNSSLAQVAKGWSETSNCQI